MIGKPISATLWQVHYSFEKPPSAIIDPKDQEPKTLKVDGGPLTLATADPTGADLCDVACQLVKELDEAPDRVTNFKLEHVHRIGDVKGLALVHEQRGD